jgi:hypothetical protein
MFGSFSTLCLMASALYAVAVDRREFSSGIVMTAIVIHVMLIAFHYLVDPIRLATFSIMIEGFFAYRVLTSDFPLRRTFAVLLSVSCFLSLMWGLDIANGTYILYDGQEPSLYRILSGALTILEGFVLIGAEHFAERRNTPNTGFFPIRYSNRKGDSR